jgi:nardilysin
MSTETKRQILPTPISSSEDKLLYRAIRLENELECLLIDQSHLTQHGDAATTTTTDADVPAALSLSAASSATSESIATPTLSNISSSSIVDNEHVTETVGSTADTKHVAADSESDEVRPCAVALSVRVGYFCDPSHAEGLAHFLEHMLFMVCYI